MVAARALSGLLAVGSFVVATLYAISYLGSPQLVRRPLPPGQESLVMVVESFGPIWPALFGTSALALVVAIVVPHRRSMIVVHMLGFFVWAFYGGSILAGALLQVPPVPILHGSVSMLFPPLHLVAALIWVQEFGYRRRRCRKELGDLE